MQINLPKVKVTSAYFIITCTALVIFASVLIFVPKQTWTKLFSSKFPNFAAVLDFNFAVNYYVGDSPVSIFSADFNKDGNMDLAVAVSGNDAVSVFLGDGNGGFGAPRSLTARYAPDAVFSADFNRDGNMDLVTANYDTDNISIFLGDGNGGFSVATSFPVGSRPQSIFAADFNKDGNMDLAVANYKSNNISVLLGDGNGGFGPATNLTVGLRPSSVFSADFNRDGNMDLVVANYNSNTISVFLGNGDGTFSPETNFTAGTAPYSIFSADFNRDGNMDLAVANYSDNNVSILLGSGNGAFSLPTNFPVGISPTFVFAADFNRDGNMDLALTKSASGDNNVSILLGDGNGRFSTTTDFTAGSDPTSIFAADFNHDGNMDLAVTNDLDASLSILINNTPALAPITTSITPTSAIVGGSPVTLTVNGANFINSSVVQFNGSDRVTTFASSTQLTAVISSSDLNTASTHTFMESTAFMNNGADPLDPTVAMTSVIHTANNGTNPFENNENIWLVRPSVSGTIVINGVSIDWTDMDSINDIIIRIKAKLSGGVTAYFNDDIPGSQKITLTSQVPLTVSDSAGNLSSAFQLQPTTATVNSFCINVFNPSPGGGISNCQMLTVNSAPIITGGNNPGPNRIRIFVTPPEVIITTSTAIISTTTVATTTIIIPVSGTTTEITSPEVATIATTTETESVLPSNFCFTKNLYPYTSDPDVKDLQVFLNGQGFSIIRAGSETDYYGTKTTSAVISFQEKYAVDILINPYGLTKGTGNFGNYTRKKINDGLGCSTLFEAPHVVATTAPQEQNQLTTAIPSEKVILNVQKPTTTAPAPIVENPLAQNQPTLNVVEGLNQTYNQTLSALSNGVLSLTNFIKGKDITWTMIIIVLLVIVSIIIVLYIISRIFKYFKSRKQGTIKERSADIPLSFAQIKVFKEGMPNMPVATKATDKDGKYNILVPKGNYYLEIEKKNLDGSYSQIFKSSVVHIEKGVINEDLIV